MAAALFVATMTSGGTMMAYLLIEPAARMAAAVAGMAWLAGIGAGLFVWRAAVEAPAQCERRRFDRYIATIRRFRALEDRIESFDLLRLEGSDPLGLLSREVHEIVVSAYQSRAESRRLRRTMESEIERETTRATASLSRLAFLDALTGLSNRRALERDLEVFIAHAKRSEGGGDDIIVLAIDLDEFKRLNDEHGHDAGDRALIRLADVLRSTLRENDGAYRLGGDEFIVLLRDISLDQAPAITERLQKRFTQVAASQFSLGVQPTLSIGVASFLASGATDGPSLIECADRALYDAKRSGKGCSTVHHRASA